MGVHGPRRCGLRSREVESSSRRKHDPVGEQVLDVQGMGRQSSAGDSGRTGGP